MALDSSDFTSNQNVDDIEIGDPTVDIVGYVIKVSNNLQSPKSSKFHKIIVSNGSGREIQIIAWNNFTRLIHSVQLGTIVLVSSLKANAIKNPAFNGGNVNFELLVKDNTSLQTFGMHQTNAANYAADEVSIVEAYDMINKPVLLQAIVRTEPRIHKNRDYECRIGSITDCHNRLEVKFTCEYSNMNLLMGTTVKIQGVMENLSAGPPTLKVDDVKHIEIIDHPRLPFKEVLQGFYSK